MQRACDIRLEAGYLICQGVDRETARSVPGLRWDPEAKHWRGEARLYRDLVLNCRDQGLAVQDRCRSYQTIELTLQQPLVPRPHQQQAIQAWAKDGYRGVVAMPTGAGKTIFAIMAMHLVKRPTLVVVPTIDLLHQWVTVLNKYFGVAIGVLGDGKREVLPITVATYDSAAMMIGEYSSQFGLLICDECHHLPAEIYQNIARHAIAPFRLGLSATVERPDGREELLYNLMGDKVFEIRIDQMRGAVLAPYDVVNIQVPLTDEEHEAYKQARDIYLRFIKKEKIAMNAPNGWQDFIFRAARSPEGRQALQAHRAQKRIAQWAHLKIQELWRIINEHRDDRIIVFTDDNALAYRIGQMMLLPVLTHKTKMAERKEFLQKFRNGDYQVIVTSKVLNEGVDVPEASVAVVVSGSAGVREHVQRLGRILRHAPEKRAVLYELVAKDTSEQAVNWRRKQHHAYQRHH